MQTLRASRPRSTLRLGLPDALGVVASLVALAWLPGAADPLTGIKLMVLAAGGLAVAPAVVWRLRLLDHPSWLFRLPALAAVALVAWGFVSSLGSAAPIWNSIFGWWGRGDGLLAWVGALVLLLGGATLTPSEVSRTITWLLAGASLVVVVGALQLVGANVPDGAGGQVSGTLGNTNFAAGYFAILALLALGRGISQGKSFHRVLAMTLFAALVFLGWATKSLQGPAALVVGIVAFGVVGAGLYRGKFRRLGLISAMSVLGLGGLLLVGSAFGIGPLTLLWAEGTFQIRQQYWESAVLIMNGLPLFGTGPDGFARYVAEYRPESYVELLGPSLRVSAAHNIALQFGAVLGWPGFLLWVLMFLGTFVALLARILRDAVRSAGLTASVAGALTAYVTQGMVSIDMLPLLATGWLVTGLALALAREPKPEFIPTPTKSPKSRRSAGSATTQSVGMARHALLPLWARAVGGALGVIVVVLVGVQINTSNSVQRIASQEEAVDFLANPMAPCVLRVQVTQQVIQQVPAEVSVPATLRATDLDPRCAPMTNFASDVLIQQKRFLEADGYTGRGVVFDPLLDIAWVLRARYYLGVGDIPAAQAALDEATRVQGLYGGDRTLTETLRRDISIAQGGGE